MDVDPKSVEHTSPERFEDVEKILKMASSQKTSNSVPQPQSVPTKVVSNTDTSKPIIIGVHNITVSAGATTLIYMMLKELISIYGAESVLAMEIDKTDFHYFYHKRMISVRKEDLQKVLSQYSNVKILLVDLNLMI